MREIKFRGVTHEFSSGPRWVYGDLICDCTDEPHIMTDYHDCYEPVTWTVDPETVGQFTGLRDAEGHEIYEGDILSNGHDTVAVSYSSEFAAFVGLYNGRENLVLNLDDCIDQLNDELKLKVIGNIHDDPKLLEASHD